MGAFFESALLFSLAVLIILIGLLIYYFKGRVNDLEQKSMKCLELVGEVYKSHLELKQSVASVASVASTRPTSAASVASAEQIGGSPRIQVHLEEFSDEDEEDSEEDSEDDSSDSDDEDDDEFPPQIKMVNVDLTETLEAEEIDIDIDMDEDAEHIGENNETEPIVVNKIDVDDISETQSVNETSTVNDRDSYKKMGLPALRGFIISKGYQTDSAKLQKMKKNELIDLIVESQK